MIEVNTFSQLGNNLFQYAFARILAEQMGYALTVRLSHLPKFEQNNAHLRELMGRFRDAPFQIGGKSFNEPEERYAIFDRAGFDGFNLDVRAIVANPEPRKIVLEGYFEKYAYYKPHKNRVRDWFALERNAFGHQVHDQDILIHVRRGRDSRIYGRLLRLDFYADVLKTLTWRRIYICCNEIDDDVQRQFAPFDPVYVRQSPPDDFCFFQCFRRIIQANSTFSWWAAYLSDAEEVYAPLEAPNPFVTLNYPEIDLTVDDEPRYRYFENAGIDYSEVPLNTKLRFWALQALGRPKYDSAVRAVRTLRRLRARV
jgi:hypothetical protein